MGLARGYVEPVPPMVSFWTAGWGLMDEGIGGTAPASGVYEAADRGVWHPVYVPAPTLAKRMWWANGATVDAGYNVEAGIYLDTGAGKPGAKLITTGSTAQGTASQVQFADITDTWLSPALYWLYLSCSSTSATFFRSVVGVSEAQNMLKWQQASIGPGSAPATATPAAAATTNLWLFGFSTTTWT